MEFGLISEQFYAAHAWLESNSDWLGPSIALVAFVESLAAVGIIVPGVAILFALGALAGSGLLDPVSMFLWAFVGAVLGDGVSFQVGRYFHEGVRSCWPFNNHPEWLDRGEVFFRDYGGLSIAIGRFVGPIRPVIPVVAGMMKMTPARFYIINILSSVPWALVYLTPGYLTGAAIHMGVPDSFYGLIIALFCTASFLAFVLTRVDEQFIRRHLYTILPLAALILAHIALTLVTAMDVSGQFDDLNGQIRMLVSPMREPVTLHLFGLITWFGSLYTLFIPLMFACGYLFYLGELRRLAMLAVTFVGMEVSLWLMKWSIDKPRPGDFDGLDQFSFPSGHTTQATFIGLVLVFSLVIKQTYVIKMTSYMAVLFCILMVGFSRLILEVHWLMDVIAGLLLGTLWFSVNVLLARQNTTTGFQSS